MMDSPECMNFWDLANPRQGARALEEMYGDAAAAAAATYAAMARSDNQNDDCCFWVAALARLQAANCCLARAERELQEAAGDKPVAANGWKP